LQLDERRRRRRRRNACDDQRELTLGNMHVSVLWLTSYYNKATHTPVESGEVMLMGDLNCRRRREKEGAAVFTVISMTYTS
jgi:hypothetical protein